MIIDELGKKIELSCYHHSYTNRCINGKIKVIPVMEIIGPTGKIILWKSDNIEDQCEAIKAFMNWQNTLTIE